MIPRIYSTKGRKKGRGDLLVDHRLGWALMVCGLAIKREMLLEKEALERKTLFFLFHLISSYLMKNVKKIFSLTYFNERIAKRHFE